MKTEFSTESPHFDAILAETWEEKDFIEYCLKVASMIPPKDLADIMHNLAGISADIGSISPATPEEIDMVDSAQSAAKEIAHKYFQEDIRKDIPLESFHFFNGDIVTRFRKKRSMYLAYFGSVYLSRQSSEAITFLEVFRQVWNSFSHSWITYDGENFPAKIGLSCSIPKEDNKYFSLVNDMLNSYATNIFYQEFASDYSCFKRSDQEAMTRNIFKDSDFEILGTLIQDIFKANERDSLKVLKDFHKAKLNGNFFVIRDYCRSTYGSDGVRKAGQATSSWG